MWISCPFCIDGSFKGFDLLFEPDFRVQLHSCQILCECSPYVASSLRYLAEDTVGACLRVGGHLLFQRLPDPLFNLCDRLSAAVARKLVVKARSCQVEELISVLVTECAPHTRAPQS